MTPGPHPQAALLASPPSAAIHGHRHTQPRTPRPPKHAHSPKTHAAPQQTHATGLADESRLALHLNRARSARRAPSTRGGIETLSAGPSLPTSGETLTIRDLLTLRARFGASWDVAGRRTR